MKIVKNKKLALILFFVVPLLMVTIGSYAGTGLYGHIDQDKCINCGQCVEVAEEIIYINDEGKACVKTQPIPPQYLEFFISAIEICPVAAISLGGGQ